MSTLAKFMAYGLTIASCYAIDKSRQEKCASEQLAQCRAQEKRVDKALEGTFPASDPPSY